MKYCSRLLFVFLFLILISCSQESNSQEEDNGKIPCFNSQIEAKIILRDDRTFLYGGDHDSMHFDVTGWNFDKCNLKLGLGRETFPALIKPKYIKQENVDFLKDQDSCIVLIDGESLKVYPYVIMAYHEAVNESVNNEPILIAYCKLAYLGAVYDRQICNDTLDFAIAGYTYSEELVYGGVRSFVMWDRQTESLWWPLDNRGVSGFFKNTFLNNYEKSIWYNTTWGEVKGSMDDIKVLHTQEPLWAQKSYHVNIQELDCN